MGELEQMMNSLGPGTGALQWNLALYWLFFLNIIILFIMPDGATLQMAMGIIVLVSIVLDKTYGFGYLFNPGRYSAEYYHEQIFFGTFLIRVAMFVFPAIMAGSTRDGKVRGLGIIACLSGAVYVFARWYMDQRDNKSHEIVMIDMEGEMVAQSVGMMLVLAQITLRRHWQLGRVNRYVPVTVAGELAADELEV